MNIRNKSIDELEMLSYQDIAYEIIKTDKKPYKTPDLFKQVCHLLEIDEDSMYEMIGEFYTNLTTDKRFLLLDDAKWDLKEFHVVKTIIDEDEDEDESAKIEKQEVETTDQAEDDAVLDEKEDYNDLDDEDDLDDLSIVTEEDLED